MTGTTFLRFVLETLAVLAIGYCIYHEADIIRFEKKLIRFLKRAKRIIKEEMRESKQTKREAGRPLFFVNPDGRLTLSCKLLQKMTKSLFFRKFYTKSFTFL